MPTLTHPSKSSSVVRPKRAAREMMAMHRILRRFLQPGTCALVGVAVATSTAFLPAAAQTPGGDAATLMVGAWELSNSDHDKTCAITFRLDATGPGRALDFDKSCAEMFPEMP